jgi:dsDNA-specific endonuclease/ATPase MutS2
LKESPPIPFDIFVGEKTRVVVISGPNTGGKTICLKTLGLAALMAKSGVYVLSSEPVKIPWFDSVFADIGDEQSLSQSLSTFSAHLKQTGEILSHSTTRSLVLLDEVGAGTNPVEGAGLGMSLLESFAESGVLLTMATTHHGELKTLKYSNNAFENACMEFDEVKLKPTYKILWGVPGRSNAMNIAERLGVPGVILKNARELYGDASAEINEVIVEMEKFKREIEEHAYESKRYLKVSREAYKSVAGGKRTVMEHGRKERYKKFNEISESASGARSFLHNKLRQLRATAATAPTPTAAATQQTSTTTTSGANGSEILQVPTNSTTQTITNPPPSSAATAGGVGGGVPKVGDTVHVTSLNKKATVIKVEPSKQQIMVQVGFMRLKLNLADVLA